MPRRCAKKKKKKNKICEHDNSSPKEYSSKNCKKPRIQEYVSKRTEYFREYISPYMFIMCAKPYSIYRNLIQDPSHYLDLALSGFQSSLYLSRRHVIIAWRCSHSSLARRERESKRAYIYNHVNAWSTACTTHTATLLLVTYAITPFTPSSFFFFFLLFLLLCSWVCLASR